MVLYSEGLFLVTCIATVEIYCVQKGRRRSAEAELSFIFDLLLAKLNADRIVEE